MSVSVKEYQPATAIVQLGATEVPMRRFTLDEYHKLIEIGFFDAGERLELIDGILVPMSPMTPTHRSTQHRAMQFLTNLVGDRAIVFNQSPISLYHSATEPEPDLTVVKPPLEQYDARHPYPEDILFVVEVSLSSLEDDQTTKLVRYAAAGIEEYWIVNLREQQLEIYQNPVTLASGNSGYGTKTIYTATQSVALPAFPELTLQVNEILSVPSGPHHN